jgi:transcriptional regulator with XRE-family HTH domain
MPRSLSVRQEYLTLVKSSLLRNGFPSQKILAEDLGLAQSTVSHFLNGKPVDFINFIEISNRLGKEWRDLADFAEDVSDHRSQNYRTVKLLITEDKRDRALTDHSCQNLAQKLQQSLTQGGYQVFFAEKNSPVGEYLAQADYLFLLLSEESFLSETLLEEIKLVQELHQKTPQKPAIFPIFLNLSQSTPLSFDLLSNLQSIPAWRWNFPYETDQLISEILSILREGRTVLPPQHELTINWKNLINQQITLNNNQFSQEKLLGNNHPIQEPLPNASPELPGGQVELESLFYMERPPIEIRCYEAISQAGALIRIKAPRQMGKTSLMARILHHAEKQGSRTVALSLQLANKRVFRDSDTFLQWFCASLGQELGLLESLTNCWQLADIIGSNQCCKAYFEQYLLPQVESLTLGLDEVDRVFESPEIADDFLGLLRALHEESKRREIWKKLRLIVVHSTEVYIPLDVNKSPFNVGLPIELPEFNSQQVQELARRHRLNWSEAEVLKLMALVGGHPYLVRLAMYHLANQDISLNQLVKDASTETGIYSDHLRRHLWNLEKYPELMAGMAEIVNSEKPVRLKSELGFKLNSMGLVKLEGNNCTPRCHLYQQYLCDRATHGPEGDRVP